MQICQRQHEDPKTTPHAAQQTVAEDDANNTTSAQQSTERTERWSVGKRIVVSLPIFVVLMALLCVVSLITTVPNGSHESANAIRTLDADTAVTFDTTQVSESGAKLLQYLGQVPHLGSYEVESKDTWINLVQPSTGLTQRAHVIIDAPKLPQSKPANHILPAVVFMHGAGYGTAQNSFGDVSADLASAGFVTARVDKPVWNTTDISRDYPGSAHAYDQVVEYLRSLPEVDGNHVGLYATSEATWIAPLMLQFDKRIAFQILPSPMVFTPRHSLGFFVAQDLAIIGAHDGYKAFVDRVFSADPSIVGLTNLDIQVGLPNSYGIATLVAYGDKDVMTAQADGLRTIESLAHRDGNTNVSVRVYSMANHVIRLGDEATEGTPLADFYERDMVDWAVGTVLGARQTSAVIAGATIHQPMSVPTSLHGHRALTIYGALLHIGALLALVVTLLLGIAMLLRKLWFVCKHKSARIGFVHGFRAVLITICSVTLGSVVLFCAAVGQIIMRIVSLIWGAAPVRPGMIYWSWYVLQAAAIVVVWAWARVFARIIEAVSLNKQLQQQPGHGHIPVIATTRLGIIVFITLCVTMMLQLFVLAFWGLYIYW